MLWALAVVLFVAWFVCFVTGVAFGGFIHVLLIAALIIVIIKVIQGNEYRSTHITLNKRSR